MFFGCASLGHSCHMSISAQSAMQQINGGYIAHYLFMNISALATQHGRRKFQQDCASFQCFNFDLSKCET